MKRKPTAVPAQRRRHAATELRDFHSQQNRRPMMAELYRRAEAKLRKQEKTQQAKAGAPKSGTGPERLLHELEVHQIELELQNAELQRARDELEVALEKYTDLYDFAPVGYFTLTADGTIQLVNLRGASLVGAERARLVGRSFGWLITAERRSEFQAFLKQVFASPAKQSGDFELVMAGQPPRFVNLEAQRLLDGRECRAAVVDITERQQAADRLRVSEVRHRRLFETAHDGILLLDAGTGKITDANPYMTKLLGYSRDQLIGKELFEIGLLKDEVASQEMFAKLKRKHEVRYEDLPLESQTGRHQEVEVVANLYQENRHAVIQCNIRDITERKQAEAALRRNEALFSALIEQAPVGVYVVDAQFRLQQVNPRAQPVFSKIHPLIGRDLSEIHHLLWPPRVAYQVVKRFRHTLKTGAPYQSPEFSERRQDTGVVEVYEWQIQRVTLPAGEQGVVCFFNNITARKQAEAAQRHLAVMTASNTKLKAEIVQRQAVEASLKQSEQEQRRLLAESRRMQEQLRHLSHQILHAQEEERKRISRELHDEIAQALVGINVHLAALTREGTGTAQGLREQIARTQRLVEKSVDAVHRFARELRPTALDDLGLIPALHTFMKEFTERTGVRAGLTAFAAIEHLDIVKRTILYRVAHEALNNVARHARASRVEVNIERQPDCICMKIKDDGKSFDVGRVLHAKGNGRLGLLGMRERLEMVGGKFLIESAPGQGTIVHAQVPVGPAPASGGARRKSATVKKTD